MSYVRMKNVFMDFEGLRLEESDSDREVVCPDRLDELLALDTEPRRTGTESGQLPNKSRLHEKPSTKLSIPACKAADGISLSRSCTLPMIHSARRGSQPCARSDEDGRFHMRSTSAPDIKYRSDNLRLPCLKTLQVQGHSPFAPELEITETLTELKTPRKAALNQPKPSAKLSLEDIPLSLSTKQCFPSPNTATQQETKEKAKILPMPRRPNPKYDKYFKTRFGRSQSTSHVTTTKVKSVGSDLHNKHWVPLGQRGPRKTREKVLVMNGVTNGVMEEIVRCRETERNGNHVTTSPCDVDMCLSCSSVSPTRSETSIDSFNTCD